MKNKVALSRDKTWYSKCLKRILPSHFKPCLNKPYNKEPQWSQKVGLLSGQMQYIKRVSKTFWNVEFHSVTSIRSTYLKLFTLNRWGTSILNLSLRYYKQNTDLHSRFIVKTFQFVWLLGMAYNCALRFFTRSWAFSQQFQMTFFMHTCLTNCKKHNFYSALKIGAFLLQRFHRWLATKFQSFSTNDKLTTWHPRIAYHVPSVIHSMHLSLIK